MQRDLAHMQERPSQITVLRIGIKRNALASQQNTEVPNIIDQVFAFRLSDVNSVDRNTCALPEHSFRVGLNFTLGVSS
jgi:hypothetical protein